MQIKKIADYKEQEINKLKEIQDEHHKRIEDLNERMQDLYKDLYDDGYDDEFEITCPYCNYYFEAEIYEDQKEIICPKCNSIIELDWNEDF